VRSAKPDEAFCVSGIVLLFIQQSSNIQNPLTPPHHPNHPPRPPKKSVAPLPPFTGLKKKRSDRSFSKPVGVTMHFPLPTHVLPLKFQMSASDRTDQF